MSVNARNIRHLLVALGGTAALSLALAGCPKPCPPCHPGPGPGAHGHHPHGKRHGHKRGWKKHGRAKMAKKAKTKLGQPKTLCAKKLIRKAKWLGLSDDQIGKIKAAKQAKKTAEKALKPKMKAAAKALRAAWKKDKPDAVQIKTLLKTYLAHKAQGMEIKLKYFAALKAALTTDQYKKVVFMSYMYRHRAHKGYGRKGRRGHKGHARKGDCNCGKRHAHKGHRGHKRHGHAHKGGCKCGKRLKNLGAPKALCAGTLMRRAKRFGLTDAQVAKLKTIKKNKYALMIDRVLAKKRARVAMKAEWLKDSPDASQLATLMRVYFAAKSAKKLVTLSYLLQVHEVLTPEQWKKVRTHRAHRGGCPGCKRHRHRGHKGHGHKHGRKGGCDCKH